MNKSQDINFTHIKLRWSHIIPLIITLLILSGCAQPKVRPPPAGEEAKRIIEVEAVDQVVHYQCQSFWSEEKFSQILESRRKFEGEQISSFKKSLEKYDKSAANTKIKIDEVSKSTTLMCDV